MIRQFYNRESGALSYLLLERPGGNAAVINPCEDLVADYLMAIEQLGLSLTFVVDTHCIGEPSPAMRALTEATECRAMLGQQAQPADSNPLKADFAHGDELRIGPKLQLQALFTPGYSPDAYSFYCVHKRQPVLFTGKTLLIRDSGLFTANEADPVAHYYSVFETLLSYPDQTMIYPGQDNCGWLSSTVFEERMFNPYLQATTVDEYKAMALAVVGRKRQAVKQ